MKTNEINNGMDIIDSRDVIDRIEDLENWIDELDEDEKEELEALRKLAEQGEGFADWSYGEGLIRDSYFVKYAQELAEDIGAIGRELQWPCYHIDWNAAAESLKQDYSFIDFDGVYYWIRS